MASLTIKCPPKYAPFKEMTDYVLYFYKGAGICEGNENLQAVEQALSAEKSVDIAVTFEYGDPPQKHSARGLLCSCYDEQAYSLAVRDDGDAPEAIEYKPSSVDLGKFRYKQGFAPLNKKYIPTSNAVERAKQKEKSQFIFSVEDISQYLYKRIFGQGEVAGLVLVTGSTGAAKSKIARGVLGAYLEERIRPLQSPDAKGKRPHLLVVGKPLESWYFNPNPDFIGPLIGTGIEFSKNPLEATNIPALITLGEAYGIDVTPRLLGKDTLREGRGVNGEESGLEEVLKNALRQKPAAVLIEEVRNPKDWEEVLRFAGSGHLVFATAHSGSLVEAMDWILKSVNAKSPAQRGEAAKVIKGLIHLKSCEASDGDIKAMATLPALWRNDSGSVNALVADGLASILPYGNPDGAEGALGRSAFVKRQLDAVQECLEKALEQEKWGLLKTLELLEQVKKAALHLDLEGE